MELLDRSDYRYSFFDGMYANVYGTLTNGVFLMGFALYLQMSPFMIGLLAAVPYLVTLVQLPGAYYICRRGGRKKIAYWTAAVARLLWLPMLAAGLLSFWGNTTHCLLVLALFLVSQAFSSVSYVAWLSWTSDLVPDEIRGSFFGTRNMLCGLAGIATVLIFGNLVDAIQKHTGNAPLSIGLPLLCAVVFGLFSLHYLNRIEEDGRPPETSGGFVQQLAQPFKERNFRRFLLAAFSWNFAVYFAAPFFALYYLRDLSYSYGFVAILSTTGAVVDMVSMQIWGLVSDRIKNKAVIRMAGWGVVFLPALWVFVRPGDVLVPILLQIISGGFWSGVNLCTSNLMLRISPQVGRVWFISAHSITSGIGRGAGADSGRRSHQHAQHRRACRPRRQRADAAALRIHRIDAAASFQPAAIQVGARTSREEHAPGGPRPGRHSSCGCYGSTPSGVAAIHADRAPCVHGGGAVEAFAKKADRPPGRIKQTVRRVMRAYSGSFFGLSSLPGP